VNTASDVPVTTLVTEPVSGNIIFGGTADGMVKLYDLRQARKDAVLSWHGAHSAEPGIDTKRSIIRIGVVLGESRTITSARYGSAQCDADIVRMGCSTSSTSANSRLPPPLY
jgi:regulator-associated protein of mTOR